MNSTWDFPGGPVVMTSPSNAGGMSLIPGQGPKILDEIFFGLVAQKIIIIINPKQKTETVL